MRRFLLLATLLSLSCTDNSRPDFVIHMVEGRSGSNPFTATDMVCISGTIRIDVAQGTEDVITQNATFSNGMPNVGVQVPSYGLLTQLHVTVNCTSADLTLIGSTPEFIPTGYGFVDIVLARPDHTVQLSTPTLVPTRNAPQLVSLGANVLVVGGEIDAAGTATPLIQGLDPVQLTSAAVVFVPLDPFSTAVGLGTSLPFTSTSFLFVSNGTYGLYDATPGLAATARVSMPFTLPASAGPDSALVTLTDLSGIAVVGGSIGGDASADITWIAADGLSSMHGMLSYPRSRPAVAIVGGKLLVAGGQAAGSPLFELVAVRGADPGIPFDPPGAAGEARYAPVLTTDLNHQFAFIALGSSSPDRDDVSTLSSTTYVLRHCLTTGASPGCMVASSDPWPDAPRADFATIAHHVGTTMNADDYETLVIGGRDATGASNLVDRIHLGIDGSVSVHAAGALSTPRSQPGVAEIGGGMVMIAGGSDDGNPLGSIELSYPLFLAPITSL